MHAKYRRLLYAFVFVYAPAALLMPLRSYATPLFNVTILGTLGGNASFGVDINNNGQVTGYSSTSDGADRAFLYSDGIMQDLGTLGGRASFGDGINDRGEVVGSSDTAGSGPTYAFLYSNGGMQNLGTLGGPFSGATAINDSGEVVGSSYTSADIQDAFLYSNGIMHDLGTLGGESKGVGSKGYGISSSGEVVGGSYTSGNDFHAFLYSGGRMRDLGTLGGTVSDAFGISNNGLVTGWTGGAGGENAFLYSNGSMLDIGPGAGYGVNDSGQVVGESVNGGAFLYSDSSMYNLNNLIGSARACVSLSIAGAINNRGQIIADGYDSDFPKLSLAFLLTPTEVPTSGTICAAAEPDTLALLGAGLAGLGIVTWRRRRQRPG